MCADTSESLIRQLVTEFQEIDGVEWCETDLILHEYKVAQDWTWQLLVGETEAGPVHEPHTCTETDMDDLDRAIIEVLRADGRAAFSVVAGQVGLDETTVRRWKGEPTVSVYVVTAAFVIVASNVCGDGVKSGVGERWTS